MSAVVITGTSTGIGYDAARYLIERGYRVYGSVRKPTDGERLVHELGPTFIPLIFDVTDQDTIGRAAEQVKKELAGEKLAGLVNNAGVALGGPLEFIDLASLRHQFEVNTIGVVAVTQAFLPLLEQPGGRIINISSVSGRLGFPFLGPYVASKFALEGLSESWRRELMVRGIDVIVIGPGNVKTPIWDKVAASNIFEKYRDSIYAPAVARMNRIINEGKENGMPVEKVSQTIFKALTIPNPKTRYALPTTWLREWIIPLYAPKRWLDRIIQRSLKLFPPPS